MGGRHLTEDQTNKIFDEELYRKILEEAKDE
jgi:hypothetical protein